MDDMTNYIDILDESLDKKIAILEEIMVISEKQKKLLNAPDLDIEQYDAYVEQKDRFADDIELLDNGFEKVYDKVGQALKDNKSLYAEKIKSLQAKVSRVTELVSGIQAEEKRMFEAVKGSLNKKRSEVGQARKTSNVAANYYKVMSKVSTDPQFMDKHN